MMARLIFVAALFICFQFTTASPVALNKAFLQQLKDAFVKREQQGRADAIVKSFLDELNVLCGNGDDVHAGICGKREIRITDSQIAKPADAIVKRLLDEMKDLCNGDDVHVGICGKRAVVKKESPKKIMSSDIIVKRLLDEINDICNGDDVHVGICGKRAIVKKENQKKALSSDNNKCGGDDVLAGVCGDQRKVRQKENSKLSADNIIKRFMDEIDERCSNLSGMDDVICKK